MEFYSISKKIPHFSILSALARKRRTTVWLVGGFLRDLYLKKNKALFDFDFCVEKDTYRVAKAFSKKIGAKLIVLDAKQKSFRLIAKKKMNTYRYDFTALRGRNFTEDLSLRDFSINTLAVNVGDKQAELIDYYNARRDLCKKLIRVVQEKVFLDDPLRILRGFSFMANYGFRLEVKTKRAMVKYKGLLKNVSGERLNEELFKILSADNSLSAIKMMDELKIIDELIPSIKQARGVFQGAYHHLDVWRHSLESLAEFERLYDQRLKKDREILDYLNEEFIPQRKRLYIIKLATLLHDIGKPFAKKRKKKKTIFHGHEKIGRDLVDKLADRLRLSFREREVLDKLIFWHLRPGYLADQRVPSQRAIYRFFRDTEEEGVAVILVSLSDWRATRGPLTDTKKRKKHERIMFKLIRDYFISKKKKPISKLIDGYDIMRKFNLSPSPLIGKILKKIKEEQALGKVKTKNQAYRVAKLIIDKQVSQ